MSPVLRGTGLMAMALLFSGCFSYIPTELDAIPAGEDVRVFVSREVISRLREEDDVGLDDSGAPQIRGRLVGRDATGLAIRIPIASRQVGFLQAPIDRQVYIPPAGIVQIERRELSKPRTGLAIGTTAALVGAVIFFILDDARTPTYQEPTTGGEAIRIPFSISLP